jgi:para-nitrobenzyl esterase
VIVDGWFLPEDESAIFRVGKQNDVALLIGSNSAEANVLGRPVPAAQYVEQTKARYGELADSYLKIYPAGSEDQARQSQMNALNDSFAWQMRTWARWQVKSGRSNAYLYYFTREPPPDAPIKGPAHDAELYYVFHNLRLYDQRWADWDRKLEEIMSSYWTNFAASGDPNGAGVPRWSAYSEADADKVMSFGETVATGQTRLDKAKSDLLEAVYAKQMSR